MTTIHFLIFKLYFNYYLQEEISDLEEQQRQVSRERQRLESQLEENTQKGANLTTKKEILMAKFCKYSEAHEAEIQDLDRCGDWFGDFSASSFSA